MAEGFKIADAYVEIEAELDRDRLAEAVDRSVSRATPRIRRTSGSTLGRGLLDGVGDALSTSFLKTVTLGISGSGSIASAFASNPITATIGVVLGGAIVAAALPAIGAGLTAGLGLLAGAGVLGIGAFLLKDNEKLQKQLTKSFGNITKSLQRAAAPLLKPFIEGIKVVEKALTGLEPIFKDIFKAASPIVGLLAKQVGPTLKPILEGLKSAMPGITAAFKGLAASLPGIGQAIGNFFKTIFQDPKIIERFTKGFGDFIAFLINTAAPAIRFLTLTWGALSNEVILLKKYLSEDLGTAWKNILAAFDGGSGAIQRITEAFAPLKVAIKAVWDAFVGFANANTDAEREKTFVKLVDSIKAAWEPLKTFVKTIWDEILAAVKRWYTDKFLPWWENTTKPWLKDKLKSMANAAFEELKTIALAKAKEVPGKILEGIKNLATTVKNDIVKQFSNAGNWLISAGEAILNGLLQGIRNKISELKTLLTSVTNLIPQFKGPMSVDKKLLYPTGQAIMGGLQDGMMSRTGALEASLNRLTNAIPAMAAPAAAGPGITVHLTLNGVIDRDIPRQTVALLHNELDKYRRSFK